MIKTKPGWNKVKGIEAWSRELSVLIEEAAAAAKNTEVEPRLEVAEYLTGFIQESWPQTPDMDKLDALAQSLVDELMDDIIASRIGAITSRTAEFVKLAKTLESAAERAESEATSIRLKNVTDLIGSATSTINAAKAITVSLDSSSKEDKKLEGLIGDAVVAIQKLRSAAASLV